jgi:hypothetical protein
MQLINPSQAIEKLKSFITAVNRLERKQYDHESSRTKDINKVNDLFWKLGLLASVAQFNKNGQRAKKYINWARNTKELASKYLKHNN